MYDISASAFCLKLMKYDFHLSNHAINAYACTCTKLYMYRKTYGKYKHREIACLFTVPLITFITYYKDSEHCKNKLPVQFS